MSKNNAHRVTSKADVKNANLNIKSDVEADTKIKNEKSMPSSTPEVSTLDLHDVSQDEKPQFVGKRKREVPPLLVSNLPERYSFLQITDYLVKMCGPCEVSFVNNGNGNAVEVIFESMSLRSKAKTILSLQSIDDQKIRVESPIILGHDSDMESDHECPQAKRKKDPEEPPWGLDMDLWRPDPKGWYGVKPQYLNSLGIDGSLQNWVLVKNFRCGIEELREVMALAGDVQVCSVSYSAPKRYARVMYRHPLEALQAVSMLNNQICYGASLSVKIIKAGGAILPKGLNNIGPGLAKDGGPVRDVIRHYERFVKGQDNELNSVLFRTPEEQSTNENNLYNEHFVNNTNKQKARDALKTLIALVDQGMKVNDLMLELKSIKSDQKDSIDEILNELEAESKDAKTNKKNDTKSREFKEQNRDMPSPSSDTSGCESRPMSPNSGRNSNEPARIATISSSRAKDIVRSKPPITTPNRPKMPQPVAPGTSSSYHGPIQRLGPVAMTPMPNPVRPIDQRTPAFGSGMMGVQSGPMPGPIQGHMPGPMPGHMPGPVPGPMPVSGPAGPMTGSMVTPNFSMPGPNTHPPFGPNVHQMTGNEATLQFSNLPLSTTFALLSDKLSQSGQLSSIQFTTPGCVLVTFAHKAFAEKCRLQFDQSRLEGNLIDVRFV